MSTNRNVEESWRLLDDDDEDYVVNASTFINKNKNKKQQHMSDENPRRRTTTNSRIEPNVTAVVTQTVAQSTAYVDAEYFSLFNAQNAKLIALIIFIITMAPYHSFLHYTSIREC
jgi:hypothetical protein